MRISDGEQIFTTSGVLFHLRRANSDAAICGVAVPFSSLTKAIGIVDCVCCLCIRKEAVAESEEKPEVWH